MFDETSKKCIKNHCFEDVLSTKIDLRICQLRAIRSALGPEPLLPPGRAAHVAHLGVLLHGIAYGQDFLILEA